MDDNVFPAYSSAKTKARQYSFNESKLTVGEQTGNLFTDQAQLVMLWSENLICQRSHSVWSKK